MYLTLSLHVVSFISRGIIACMKLSICLSCFAGSGPLCQSKGSLLWTVLLTPIGLLSNKSHAWLSVFVGPSSPYTSKNLVSNVIKWTGGDFKMLSALHFQIPWHLGVGNLLPTLFIFQTVLLEAENIDALYLMSNNLLPELTIPLLNVLMGQSLEAEDLFNRCMILQCIR